MAFQTTIGQVPGFGVQGEIRDSSPQGGLAYTITSVSEANNIIGYTVVTQQATEGVVAAGQGASSSSVFAGFLAAPKDYALYSGTFTPSLTVANGSIVSVVYQGKMTVYLPAAAAIGDYVCYNTTTGRLTTIAPGATLAAGTLFAQARVVDKIVTGAGLAVILINPTFVIPAAA